MRGDGKRPDVQGLAVHHDLYVLHCWEAIRLTSESVLRIVDRRFAALYRTGARGARRDRRARGTLERRDTSRVIEVGMGIDNQAYVFGPEPELTDIGVDKGSRLRETSVEQDEARVRGDQHRTQTRNADVVRVPENTKGLAGDIPVSARIADFGAVRPQFRSGTGARSYGQNADEYGAERLHRARPGGASLLSASSRTGARE